MADLSSSKYCGTWRGTSISFMGKTESLTVENVLAINGDGTATYSSPSEVKEFTWRETSYGVFLDGKADMKLKAVDETLQTKVLGIVTLIFEREK